MFTKKLNPSLKFLLAFIVSLELSIKASLIANFVIIIFSLIYLLLNCIKLKDLFLLLILPLIAAFTVFATLYWFSPQPDHYYAWVLSTRIYAYLFAISCVVKNTSAEEFTRSLEQNLYLPSKFCYGVLAALNIVPQMKMAVKKIRTSAMMRGVYLSFYSPSLYFKAILVAIRVADNLAQGMQSHGYQEGQKRSSLVKIPLSSSDWMIFALILFLFNIILWFFK